METKLRQLVIQKRTEKSVSIEDLAAAINCRQYELRGYEQGLFNLGKENLCRVIRALTISESELTQVLGNEAAQNLLNECNEVG